MIQVQFDNQSLETLNRIASSLGTWDNLMHDLTSFQIAEASKEYMKPLMSVRPVKTGSAENNLRTQITSSGSGFTIDFYSNFYANFVDEGSPFTRLFASSYGLWAFPIKTGEGGKIFRSSISGVGQGNSPYAGMLPTHFSQKTADHMETEAVNIAFENMMAWIERAVG